MLFNSFEFIFLFLPVTLMGFFLLGRVKHAYAAAWLAYASLIFYGYWNVAYVGLMLSSIIANYNFGLWIAKAGVSHDEVSKKCLIIAAITANLLLLAYYKYANFFISSVNSVTGIQWSLGDIILPLGISFFTFTQIAYLVDTYQGKVKENNFVHYLLFVTYFPHLIAGPLLHHKQMMPQFALPITYRFSNENFSLGVAYFTIGLAKKVLLADNLSEYATPVFSTASIGGGVGFLSSWIGVVAYSFQLYFDFSGYCDMAVGISKMFGINLPLNFNSPYKARSIIQFWQRWHMTLSQFLRDYLYIPLGGNRNGHLRRHANIMLTMLLGGLWHGASYTFVVWGFLHGIYLIINHVYRHFIPSNILELRVASVMMTFVAVTVAWVFFRAETLSAAIEILKGMAGINGISFPMSWSWMEKYTFWIPMLRYDGIDVELLPAGATPSAVFILFGVSSVIIWLLPNSQDLISKLSTERLHRRVLTISAAVSGVMFSASLLSFNRVSEFLYFQF
jgi:alginate O-acetyltransferase complex protein AlgI